MKKRPLKILLVDDHPIVRAGLRQILANHFKAEFTETGDAASALEACRTIPFDLMLLDVNLPGRSGLDLLVDLSVCAPLVPVLVLSMHAEEQYARRAFRSGAAGYITKSSVSEKLVEAAKKIMAGGRYVSAELAESLVSGLGGKQTDRSHEDLSVREFEVFRLIVSGKSGKEIADALSLSFKTVSTYRTRILQKLGVGSTAELTQYAAREDLF